MERPAVSLVLPAYNEGLRIRPSLATIEGHLERKGYAWEIIVVDDGSTDETWSRFEEHRQSSRNRQYLRGIQNGTNRGKGFSVRAGFLAARKEIVLFSDSDLSTPIEEMEKLLEPIRNGTADATFGSRALSNSIIGIHQPWYREYGGKCFNLLMRVITGLPFRDTQCGFKAFRREVFSPVFEKQRLERFGFDVEILYLGKKMGLSLQEIPVTWSHCDHSKVRFGRDAVSMLFDLWRIRWNDIRSRYKDSGTL